jgi:hypothetical protein
LTLRLSRPAYESLRESKTFAMPNVHAFDDIDLGFRDWRPSGP